MLLAVVLTAATLNFLLPKLAPMNPVETKLLQLQESGGALTDIKPLVDAYNAKFGLEKPLLVQYRNYLTSTVRFDLGYSIAFYPARVIDLIGACLAVDHRAAADQHADGVRARHAARRGDRVGTRAAHRCCIWRPA